MAEVFNNLTNDNPVADMSKTPVISALGRYFLAEGYISRIELLKEVENASI